MVAKKKKSKEMMELEKDQEGMVVTTADVVPGYEVTKYKGFVWGTTVQAKFVGHDILAIFRTIIGGEIWPYTRMINEARHYVVHRMVQNAKALGADAVIGVRMGTAQIIPGTVEIFAYGTAVNLKK